MKKLLLSLPLLLGAVLLFAKTTAPLGACETSASRPETFKSATGTSISTVECDPKDFTLEICRLSTGELIVNIEGVKVQGADWTLHKALDCAGGTRPDNFDGGPVAIQWLSPGKTFMLPYNSGCYILSYVYVSPDCPFAVVANMINTNLDFYPSCGYECDTWNLVIKHKNDIPMHVGAIASTPFPPGTVITFTLDNKVVQTGDSPYYSFGTLELGTHVICITVARPDCPPLTKCETIYVWERPVATNTRITLDPGKQGVDSRTTDQEGTDLEHLRYSNPAYGTVYLSQTIRQGTATIFSVQGDLVKSFELSDTNQLNVSEVAAGPYLLAIKTPEQLVSRLLLIATPK